MITLSAEAKDALRQDGAELTFKADIGAPVSKDISALVIDWPSMRSSVRPLERTPELSNLSLHVFNKDGVFDPWNAGTWLVDGFNFSRVTVKLGIKLPPAGEELVTVFVGELDDAIGRDLSQETVELVCVDPLARLRRNTIGDNAADQVFMNESPTAIVKELLIWAGFGSDLDATSFTTIINQERAEAFRVGKYTVPKGTGAKWWNEIEALLRQVNGGIRWNTIGKIETFKYVPASTGAVYTFDSEPGRTASAIRTQRPGGDILNKFRVEIDDGSGEAFIESNNSPISDSGSIAKWGEISEVLQYGFTTSPPAENTSAEILDVKALPPRIFQVAAPIESFVVELWDLIRVIDRPRGIDEEALVFDRKLVPSKAICEFKVFATSLTDQPWLFTANGQDYDDGQLVF